MSDDIVERLRQQAIIEAKKYGDAAGVQIEWRAAAEIERLREQLHLATIDGFGAHAEANELRDALTDAVALIERIIDTRRCAVANLRALNKIRAALGAKP